MGRLRIAITAGQISRILPAIREHRVPVGQQLRFPAVPPCAVPGLPKLALVCSKAAQGPLVGFLVHQIAR